MRYLLTIEYLGLQYSGWQRQENACSVQEAVEKSLSEFFKENITVFASGRTDKGVHALGQTLHFDAKMVIPERNLPLAINHLLPDDIKIKTAKIVDANFHARYDAKKKTYIYKFYIDKIASPTKSLTHAQLIPPIDIVKMQKACLDLLGTYDFACLSATGSSAKTSIRTVYEAHIKQCEDEVIFTITASGFLYNMVRMIAGTLAFIAQGKREVTIFRNLIETQDKKLRGKTYPPQGLYLAKVIY